VLAIEKIPRNQDAILWLKNVAFSVQLKDLEDYLKQHNIRAKKMSNMTPGVFKIFLDHQNAVRLASIPDNVSSLTKSDPIESQNLRATRYSTGSEPTSEIETTPTRC
jgi:hypothetical protein